MASPAPSNRDVGRTLRRARQRHHVELEAAAEETRIPKRYLEALEDNAPLDTYPAPVYARAFLREYAKYLQVDAEALIGAFGSGSTEEIHLHSIREALPAPRRWPSQVLLAMSIGALVALAVLGILSGRTEQGGLGRVTELGAKATGPRPAATHRHHVPPPITGIKATMRFVDRCWVLAEGDGNLLVRQTFEPPATHELDAKRSLRLTLGNGGGVQLLLNGRSVSTGGTGDVVHLSVVLQDGHVHVTRT